MPTVRVGLLPDLQKNVVYHSLVAVPALIAISDRNGVGGGPRPTFSVDRRNGMYLNNCIISGGLRQSVAKDVASLEHRTNPQIRKSRLNALHPGVHQRIVGRAIVPETIAKNNRRTHLVSHCSPSVLKHRHVFVRNIFLTGGKANLEHRSAHRCDLKSTRRLRNCLCYCEGCSEKCCQSYCFH